jgi:hypothetical protein
MFIEKPVATAEQLAEAAKLREAADRANRKSEESFQRSDTDGFLSQWALDIGARRDREQAKVLENGGCAQFRVLVNAEGVVIADRRHEFQNQFSFRAEYKWRVADEHLACTNGRKWIPTGDKSRVQKQFGLREEMRWMPAKAVITGSGTGLSGCASAYVTVERVFEPQRRAA